MPKLKFLEINDTKIDTLHYYPKLIDLLCSKGQVHSIHTDYKVKSCITHKNKLLLLEFIN